MVIVRIDIQWAGGRQSSRFKLEFYEYLDIKTIKDSLALKVSQNSTYVLIWCLHTSSTVFEKKGRDKL